VERALRSTLRRGRFQNLTANRSRQMASVRSKQNKTTELTLRMAFVRGCISGWVIRPEIFGHPDFYFPDLRLAVFVDGCFWHACRKCGHTPSNNRRYWSAKLRRNRERDLRINKSLRIMGISVVRFWEHELLRHADTCAARINMTSTRLNLSRAAQKP